MNQPFNAIFTQALPLEHSRTLDLDEGLAEDIDVTDLSQQIMVETDPLDDLLAQIIAVNQKIDNTQLETNQLSVVAQEALDTLEKILD